MKRFLVWGLGRSGTAAVELLKRKGFEVFSGDDSKGDRWEDLIEIVDTVVLSPGIAPTHPLWKEAKRKELEIIGELELADRFFKGRKIAITGTDGKSTTSRLIYLMLSSAGFKAFEAGNSGVPLSRRVLEGKDGIAVLEVSSFQGKTLKNFRPEIGIFINFSPDHLDWHTDIKDYLNSKYNIFKRQKEEDLLFGEFSSMEISKTPSVAKRIDISKEVKIEKDFVKYNGDILFSLKDLKLRGQHNLKNVLLASLVAYHTGVSPEKIRSVIRNFKGLPFRLEHLITFKGIKVYNDSKSTTPNALKNALESFPNGKVILIAGGKDKGADFSFIKETVRQKVKFAIFIGETAEKLKDTFRGDTEVKTEASLEKAVKMAFERAKPGDFILFSPGCSSFDMFPGYRERGEAFNRIVKLYKYVRSR